MRIFFSLIVAPYLAKMKPASSLDTGTPRPDHTDWNSEMVTMPGASNAPSRRLAFSSLRKERSAIMRSSSLNVAMAASVAFILASTAATWMATSSRVPAESRAALPSPTSCCTGVPHRLLVQ